MIMNDLQLKARAKRAYAASRMQRALRAARFVPLLTGFAVLGCNAPGLALVAGGLLLMLVVGLHWRGESAGACVAPGVLGGLVAWVAPCALEVAGVPVAASNAALALCAAGGLAGGLVMSSLIRRREARGGWMFAAVALCGLTGGLGCVVAGAASWVGTVAGLAMGSLPALALVGRSPSR